MNVTCNPFGVLEASDNAGNAHFHQLVEEQAQALFDAGTLNSNHVKNDIIAQGIVYTIHQRGGIFVYTNGRQVCPAIALNFTIEALERAPRIRADFNDNCVVCGPDGVERASSHIGNERLDKLVDDNLPEFYSFTGMDEEEGRNWVAGNIVKTVEERGGKFVRETLPGQWREVDKKDARRFVLHVLLHGMPREGEQIFAPLKASRPPAHESPIQQAPTGLLRNMVEFLNLGDRMRLARCSTSMLRKITKETPSLWTSISFATSPGMQRAKLTDDMVSSLLTRVNAHQVTKSVDLTNCARFEGTALEPLRGSRVLERISIDGGGVNDLISTYDILRTCIPYNLSSVNLPEAMNSDAEAQFHRDLEAGRHSMQRYLQGKDIKCRECSQPVVDKHEQVIPQVFGMPSRQCSKCCTYACGKASCSLKLTHCGQCGSMSCNTCADGPVQCGLCRVSYCKLCKPVAKCKRCDELYCKGCRVVATCRFCNLGLCNLCLEREGIVYSECICEDCTAMACSDCSRNHMSNCHGCRDTFDNDCALDALNFCESCDERFCEDCLKPCVCGLVCASCQGKFPRCSDCGYNVCTDCLVRKRPPLCSNCGEKKKKSKRRRLEGSAIV